MVQYEKLPEHVEQITTVAGVPLGIERPLPHIMACMVGSESVNFQW